MPSVRIVHTHHSSAAHHSAPRVHMASAQQHTHTSKRSVPASYQVRPQGNRRVLVRPGGGATVRTAPVRTGTYSMGVTEESALVGGPGKWAGHMLTLVQDVLVDASLDQFNRPQHNIVLPSFITVPARTAFLEYRSQLAGTSNGCEIVYKRTRDNAWRSAPDWTNESRARRAVNAIIGRVDSAWRRHA